MRRTIPRMKLTGAAAAIIATLALTGCGSGSNSHKTPSSADNQVAYIATVRGILDVNDYTDAKLVSIAHSQCDMLTTGSSRADVVTVMQDNTAGRYTTDQLTNWVGAAASAYCPNATRGGR